LLILNQLPASHATERRTPHHSHRSDGIHTIRVLYRVQLEAGVVPRSPVIGGAEARLGGP
jgi:hypothetical protein